MSKTYRLLIAATTFAASAFPAAAQNISVQPAPDSAEAEPVAESPASTATEAGPITAATADDIRTGLEVRDVQGGMVGTVEAVDSEGAVVATGNARAKLPFRSFGKNNLGLVISLTRAELEEAAAAQAPS